MSRDDEIDRLRKVILDAYWWLVVARHGEDEARRAKAVEVLAHEISRPAEDKAA